MKVTNRRGFLAFAARGALLSSWWWGATGPAAEGKRPGRRLNRIGLQLYTLRNELQKDFPGTLAKVAAIGYREVEFAGYYNRSPAEVKSILAENKLTAPAAHIPLAAVRENLAQSIDTALTIGHRYLVCPYLLPAERKSLDDYKKLAELFNRAGAACRKQGLQFCYHNHDFEFEAMNGQLPYDLLLRETDPKLVMMELDLYWVAKAGQSPARYFALHPGRFPLFHVKDMDETPRRHFTEVGRGTINFRQIFAHARRAGVKHFFVEQDETPKSPFDSIEISFNNLRRLSY